MRTEPLSYCYFFLPGRSKELKRSVLQLGNLDTRHGATHQKRKDCIKHQKYTLPTSPPHVFSTILFSYKYNIEIYLSSIAPSYEQYNPVQVQIYRAYMGPYRPSRAGSIRENINPAARAIRRTNSSNIALNRRKILELNIWKFIISVI